MKPGERWISRRLRRGDIVHLTTAGFRHTGEFVLVVCVTAKNTRADQDHIVCTVLMENGAMKDFFIHQDDQIVSSLSEDDDVPFPFR